MSTTIALDLPFATMSDKGFEVVITKDGQVVSRTIRCDMTKAQVKKDAIESVKWHLDKSHGRGDWTATIYDAHLNSSTDLNTSFVTNEWVRTKDTPFFTF